MQTYFKSGSWNVVCQVCGRRYKSDQIRKRWDGLLVCSEDYEERNILDFQRTQPERQDVPYQNNEPTDEFILSCTIRGNNAIPAYAVPGCMIPGYINTIFITEAIPLGEWLHQTAPFAIPDVMIPDYAYPDNINHGGNDLYYVFDSMPTRVVVVADNRPGHEGETFLRAVP